MNNSIVHESPALMFQASRRPLALGLAGPPSFARALRQRGLIAQTKATDDWRGDWRGDEPDDAGEWIPVLATFAAHLRRRAMEQAFAELRGDAV